MTNLYEEYALITAQIKALEEKRDEKKEAIMQQMQDKGTEKQVHSLGSFSITKLKKWTYPEYILDLVDHVKAKKAKKAKAESTGEATFTEEPSLRFTAAKL